MRFRLDPDFHILIERGKKSDHPRDRVAARPSIHQGAYFWLIDAEDASGCTLAQFSFPNDCDDAAEQFGLDCQLVGVREAQIRKYISAPPYPLFFACVCIAHFSLSPIRFTSDRDVSIPFFDF